MDGDTAKNEPIRIANAATETVKRKKGRTKGSGCLYKHGKTWMARWIMNGKRFVRSTGEHDKEKAWKKLDEFTAAFQTKNEQEVLANLEAKITVKEERLQEIQDAEPTMTVSDAFDAYKRSPERSDTSEATLDMYASQFKRFTSWLSQKHPEIVQLRHVTREMALEFSEYLTDLGLSSNTYNKYVVLLNNMWEVLDEKAKLKENPWSRIRRKVIRTHTRRELTPEELSRVQGLLTGEDRILFALGIYTGLRLGDCCLMEWGMISLETGFITLIPRKIARHAHGKPTRIPIHPALRTILEETPVGKRKGFVIPATAEFYRRDQSSLVQHVGSLFEKAGIATQSKEEGKRAQVDVGFHSLRHTFVSRAANAGAPLALVQAIVGHSSPAMTRHYFHENETALQKTIEVIPAVGSSAAPESGKPRKDYAKLCADMSTDELNDLIKFARAEISRRLK